MKLFFAHCRWAVFLPALLWLGVGCAGWRGHSRQVGEIHLFGLPSALSVPGSSFPLGVGVRIYASETGGSQGIPIRRGRLELLLFDRPSEGLDPKTQAPLRLWAFPATDLPAFAASTMAGTCYTLELKWNQTRPKGNLVTVVARYIDTDKTEILSTPTVIALTAH